MSPVAECIERPHINSCKTATDQWQLFTDHKLNLNQVKSNFCAVLTIFRLRKITRFAAINHLQGERIKNIL